MCGAQITQRVAKPQQKAWPSVYTDGSHCWVFAGEGCDLMVLFIQSLCGGWTVRDKKRSREGTDTVRDNGDGGAHSDSWAAGG